ncbi:hypothetical protein VNI00_002187 [Paramarasmius palmivorus]|uniref:Uncharacterized protein n=1 Tax=Paramarasmius palmivorus TaxID=297713 RepID=A0AAW0E0N5_9AGAR
MPEIASIVVASIALLGTLLQALTSGWFSLRSEEHKRQETLRNVIAKYRDPLARATEDLFYKLTNIIETNFASFASEYASDRHRTYAVMHTSYVFGQFFAWVHILRHDTQFLLPSTHVDSVSRDIDAILRHIRTTLSSDSYLAPFMLWSGEQLGMSEVMVVRDAKEDGGQVRCMGYATFCERWRSDEQFRNWFEPIADGMGILARYPISEQFERIARVQHLLVDLADILNPQERNPDVARVSVATETKGARSRPALLPLHGGQRQERLNSSEQCQQNEVN